MNRVAALEGKPILTCYSDGGMVGGMNPSSLGVAWAWCHVVVPGLRAVSGSGVITPQDVRLRVVGSNLAEFAAAVRCLKALPEGWSGRFYCDSRVTIGRLFYGWDGERLPVHWREAGDRALQRLGEVEPIQLKGHPSQKDLALGMKGDLPVSVHNVWCDQECKRVAQAFLAQHQVSYTPNGVAVLDSPKSLESAGV